MNILFVSIAFPPKNDPECIQSGRFFKYLSREKDFDIDVVTSKDPTLFMPVDDSLKPLDRGYRQKIAIPIFENRLTNYILRKVGLGKLMFPDSKMTFHWQVNRVRDKLKTKPDLIYSRSNPISSAFLGAALKRIYQVPWVMHFSDPWALSPLEPHDSSKLKAEEELLRDANHVTFTTEGTRQLYVARYPHHAEKFSVVPNVFDEDELASLQTTQNKKFTIVYTGGLAGKRSLNFLDDVLVALQNIAPSLLDKISIQVAGPMDRANGAYFAQTPFRCIEHLGMLSYGAAKELQQRADLLLVADNPTDSQGAVFFPSKLLDYFLTGKKILAITPLHSTSRKILEDYNAACFTNTEALVIAAYLRDEIQGWTSGRLEEQCMPPTMYSAKENAAHVAKLFRNTVA